MWPLPYQEKKKEIFRIEATPKRVAGLDFGKKRIGVALSDTRKILATPLFVLETSGSLKENAGRLKEKLADHLPLEAIVVGLPRRLSGEESDLSRLTRQFAAVLKEVFGTPVIFWDERLTSSQVERSLRERGVPRKKRAEVVDKSAAALILQNYLDAQ